MRKNKEFYIPIAEALKRPYVGEYIERLKALKYAPKSLCKRLFSLRIFLDWLDKEGGCRLQDVTARDMEQFIACKRTSGLAGATVDGMISDVKKFFRYLEDTQRIFSNPLALLKVKWTPKRLKPVPTEAEMKRLLSQPDTSKKTGIRDRALMETAYSTGSRLGELIGMTIFDIDLDKGVVRVTGKNSKERMVPLGRHAVKWLGEYLRIVRPVWLGVKLDVHALWLGKYGKALRKSAIEMILETHSNGAGIRQKITPHSVRRACATHMLRGGAHPVQVQMLLGHATLTTLGQYLQVTVKDMKNMHKKSRPGR
jgi:integrase/recombinase XerD